MATDGEIRVVLETIADLLLARRDRFGRLDFNHMDSKAAEKARETIRLFAIKYNVVGCKDVLEQASGVARAVLK